MVELRSAREEAESKLSTAGTELAAVREEVARLQDAVAEAKAAAEAQPEDTATDEMREKMAELEKTVAEKDERIQKQRGVLEQAQKRLDELKASGAEASAQKEAMLEDHQRMVQFLCLIFSVSLMFWCRLVSWLSSGPPERRQSPS